ncbi:nucleotidyltransferase family protein [Endozoicomonas arenosclerae]|uniref:nucleotidyltransferase family protein n=1 Tax=Endozoicomonas arenosclerae TaxID=1633495 RepID=UPI000780A027|nr:nucleotidyltransferase family protein [Endozoicomonas arenosclerae]
MTAEISEILKLCLEVHETLSACRHVGLPDYYLAGGAITQVVWNHKLGLPLLNNVKDFDVVYFARHEQYHEAEFQRQIDVLVNHDIPVDVKNQANVHEWYPLKFGNEIEPYSSSEEGIASWLPAFAVGVRLEEGGLKVFAPYGLEDLMNMYIRPNKTVMTEQSYRNMTKSFKHRWPEVTIESW